MRSSRAPQRLLLAVMLCLCAAGARANIRINITGVDGAPRANIEARLSISRFRDSDDLDEDTIRRLSNRIIDEVKAAMVPFGYYEPKVMEEHRQESKD